MRGVKGIRQRLARCQYANINGRRSLMGDSLSVADGYVPAHTHTPKSHQWQKVRRHSKHTVPPDTLQCRSVISGKGENVYPSVIMHHEETWTVLIYTICCWSETTALVFPLQGNSLSLTQYFGEKRTKWNYPLIIPKLGYLGVSQSRRLLKSIITCWLLLPQSCQFFFLWLWKCWNYSVSLR